MKKILSKISSGAALATIATVNAVAPAFAAKTKLDITASMGGREVQSDFSSLLSNVINIIFTVAALITFFYLVWGAINWITSGGDKGKVEDARNKITAAVIGLLILAASWAVFQLILNVAFGGNTLDFGSLND